MLFRRDATVSRNVANTATNIATKLQTKLQTNKTSYRKNTSPGVASAK